MLRQASAMNVTRRARLLRAAAAFATASLAAGCAGGGGQGILDAHREFGYERRRRRRQHHRANLCPGQCRRARPSGFVPPSPATPPPVGAFGGTSANLQTLATPPVCGRRLRRPDRNHSLLALRSDDHQSDALRRSELRRLHACGPRVDMPLRALASCGVYTGTIGSAAIAFTVAPGSNNTLNLTMGGVPSQIAVVPASYTSAQGQQGVIDLYGAGAIHCSLRCSTRIRTSWWAERAQTFRSSQAGGALSVARPRRPRGLRRISFTSRPRRLQTEVLQFCASGRTPTGPATRACNRVQSAAAACASTFGRSWRLQIRLRAA